MSTVFVFEQSLVGYYADIYSDTEECFQSWMEAKGECHKVNQMNCALNSPRKHDLCEHLWQMRKEEIRKRRVEDERGR